LDCKICKIVLINQDELINHLKIHTGSRTTKGAIDKKFCCDQCDKKFFTRKDLKRHSVVHTGNREFSCPHCSQRFGRKDHMTRHAKKTHHQFYEGERQRMPSTPTPGGRVEAAKNSRKERSVSDPGPVLSARFSPDLSIGLQPLVRPNISGQTASVADDFNKLATVETMDSSSRHNLHYVLKEKGVEIGREGCAEPVYSTSVGTASSQTVDQMFTIPEACLRGGQSQSLHESEVAGLEIKANSPPVSLIGDITLPHSQSFMKTEDELKTEDERKMDIFAEDSNSTENAMKELMDEKDKIDFVSFINEIDDNIFQRKPIELTEQTQTVFCEVKEEPSSRPATPIDSVVEPLVNMQAAERDNLNRYLLPDQAKVIPKPVFIRTQSQDSLTKTKNPVLPNVHTEGTLVVPEPKQVRYSSQDLFTLEFEEDAQQLTELKGSLFLSDDDNQSYFQPWQ